MRKLKIPTEEHTVWKTGLPFYDAARLIGAAHLLFGTATVMVEDRGSCWVMRGPKLAGGRRRQQLAWVLEELPPYVASAKNLRKTIVDNVLTMLPAASQQATKHESGVYYYLESALQTGVRGADPLASYRNLASQAGAEFNQPLEDVANAALGVSFAAICRGGRGEAGERRILPLLERGHLVLGPFLDFRRSYQHEAGSSVAAVWASLALLEELMGRDLPVTDFAFNWVVPRQQSSSGYVGVDRVCGLLREHKERGQDLYFARQVRAYLAGTARNADPAEHDLARALAHFTTTAEVKHLETIVRLKARLMAKEEEWPRRRAEGLFNSAQAVKEVKEMTEQQVDVPEGLTWALARWFTGGGQDGWIGQFIKLENASGPDRFLDETERILSRGRMHRDNPVQYSPSKDEQQILKEIRGLSGPQFRSLRAVLLLDLQAKMTYEGRRSAASSQESAKEPQEVTNE